LIFLFLSVTTLLAEKNILVLHSYHHGLDWSDSISQGLHESTSKYPEKIKLYFEYIDAKRYSGTEFLLQTFSYFALKHSQSHFDAIVVADNDALEFMNLYRDQLFPGTPVVFCGINDYSPTMTSNLTNVTGVKEVVDYTKTLALARELFPNRTKVLMALDGTTTAQKVFSELQEMKNQWDKKYEFSYLNDFNESSLKEFVAANQHTMIIYILAYNKDMQGHFFNFEDGVTKIEELVGKDVPIFGSSEFLMGKGIVGGALIKGYVQGSKAASLLMQILDGKETTTLPLQSNLNENSLTLDYHMMQKFGLKRPPDMAVNIINEPINFLLRYKITLIGLVGLVLFFILTIVIFEWRNRFKNRMLKELNASLENSVQLALQESKRNEELFKFIADSAHYVIWVVDVDHTLTYINAKAKEYFMHEQKPSLGSPNFEFLPPEYYDMLQGHLEQLKADKSLEYVEFDMYCASIEKHMKNYIVPITDHDGGIAGYKGVIHDITQDKIQLDSLKIEAQTDYLTGTLNRTTFDKELERLLIEYTRFSKDVCVMMLDVDYFKKVNDTFGHFMGDYVLKKLAHLIKAQVRKSDFVFRYGGEEFAIILPDITLEHARIIAEKIRYLIESQNFKVEDRTIEVTLSIGLSLFEKEDQSISKVVIRADEALYRAKNNGRNRVEVNYEGIL
jgi:diguanylate cyclase (GGDEF)-like protein/PAS domain S-box-containing protein